MSWTIFNLLSTDRIDDVRDVPFFDHKALFIHHSTADPILHSRRWDPLSKREVLPTTEDVGDTPE